MKVFEFSHRKRLSFFYKSDTETFQVFLLKNLFLSLIRKLEIVSLLNTVLFPIIQFKINSSILNKSV